MRRLNPTSIILPSIIVALIASSILTSQSPKLVLNEIFCGFSCLVDNLTILSKEIALLNPDFIAVEPPELIGSGIPVSKANPEIVVNTVNAVRSVTAKTIVLCGAGISSGDDVRKALQLGTKGVLVASAIVKNETPENILIDFANAVK